MLILSVSSRAWFPKGGACEGYSYFWYVCAFLATSSLIICVYICVVTTSFTKIADSASIPHFANRLRERRVKPTTLGPSSQEGMPLPEDDLMT